MVSLQQQPTTPYYQSGQYQYQSNGASYGASPISVTMEPEEGEPKTMSVQERIRALNKSTQEPSNSTSRVPVKQRAPWQVKAAARTKSPPSSPEPNSIKAQKQGDTETQPSPLQQVEQTRKNNTTGLMQIPDDELDTNAYNHVAHNAENKNVPEDSSNSVDTKSSEAEAQTNSNDLGQPILDSAPKDESNMFEDSEDGTEEFDASAAVKYWRKSKGEPEHQENTATTSEVMEVPGHITDLEADDDHGSSQAIEESVSHSACDETFEDLSAHEGIKSSSGHAKTGEHEVEMQSDTIEAAVSHVQPEQVEKEAPSPPQSEVSSKPPSPPVIMRTIHSYPDLDAIEKKHETSGNEEEKPQHVETEDSHSVEVTKDAANEEPEKQKPATTRSFSQRAFEKRSKRRAAKQNDSTPVSPKSKNDSETIAEVESASVFSGSTTHSAASVHTTTLSSRATRLLREKRQGNVPKTDGLAKSLAKNLLREKSNTDAEPKESPEPIAAIVENDVHSETQSSTTDNCVLDTDVPPKVADNSIPLSGESDNLHDQQQQLPAGSATPLATNVDEGHRYSNSTINYPPLDHPMQRQLSHISQQYSNPIPFGQSPSFQNVEVGITTGPTVNQMQKKAVPYHVSPVVGMPYGHPSADPRYNRVAQVSNELLVQPKFSRYNSFDVQNPKPIPIQNVLTEDSASWCESRTMDDTQDGDGTQDGTLDSLPSTRNTPVDSICQESMGHGSTGRDNSSIPPSIESIPRLDSFPKGRSFDKGCTVFEHIQNVCEALSPKSCNPEIVSNPTIQSDDLIHAGSTFSNKLSGEDVAIEVEYVSRSREQEHDGEEDEVEEEEDDGTHSMESGSIYSLSTRDMESKDSYSLEN